MASCILFVESKTQTYHGQVGSGRTAGRWGRVGQDWTPTEQFAQETNVPHFPQGIEDSSPEARTSEILRKTMVAHNNRMTHSLQRVHPQFIARTKKSSSFLAADQWTDILLCSCRPVSCKACPEGNNSQTKKGRNTSSSQPVYKQFVNGLTKRTYLPWLLSSEQPTLASYGQFAKDAPIHSAPQQTQYTLFLTIFRKNEQTNFPGHRIWNSRFAVYQQGEGHADPWQQMVLAATCRVQNAGSGAVQGGTAGQGGAAQNADRTFRTAPPRRPAVRPDPTSPWYVRVLDSTGQDRYPSHNPDGAATILLHITNYLSAGQDTLGSCSLRGPIRNLGRSLS